MSKRRKSWSKLIEESGVSVRLYERPGSSKMVWYSIVREDGSKARKSLKTSDRDLAEDKACAIARSIAELRLTGVDPRRLTIYQVFAAYFQHHAPGLSATRARDGATRRDLFEACWGRGRVVLDISQTDIDRYSRARRSGELIPDRKGRAPTGVRDGTIDGDFRWLSSVFNWARKHKEGGRRLLPENPLHDVNWPKEQNPLRAVASHDRFTATMAHAKAVDPKGRLGAILALLRFTGRRLGAICGLTAADVLRSPEQIRTALAHAGMDERLADHMPHGAARWSERTDKMGLLFIAPLSSPVRIAIDEYLRASPRLGSVPLFPAPGDASAQVDSKLVGKWIRRAEGLAKLPKLRGSTAHAYRRLWASERKHMPDVDVAAAGGWKDTRALKLSYQHADPETVLRVVENESA